MDVHSFHSWLQRHKGERRQHNVPAADLVVPVIAQAGPRGLSRSDIGKAIDLDREALDSLLAGLVDFGLLRIAKEAGIQVFRTTGGAKLPDWVK